MASALVTQELMFIVPQSSQLLQFLNVLCSALSKQSVAFTVSLHDDVDTCLRKD